MPEAKKLTIMELAEIIKFPTTIGKDAVVVIAGGEGDGKSLFVNYGLGPAINPDWDLWNSVVYTEYLEEFNEKYGLLKSAWSIDEAVKILYKLDFMLGTAKDLVKLFTADVRKEKGAIHFLCIPDISELNKYFREQRVSFWIEFIQREHLKEGEAAAMVFQKPRIHFRPTNVDVWLLKEYYEKFMKAFKRVGYGERTIEVMRQHPFYIGEINFKKPSDKKIETYLRNREIAIDRYSGIYGQKRIEMGITQQKWKILALRIIKDGVLNHGKSYMDYERIGKHIIAEQTLSRGIAKMKDE